MSPNFLEQRYSNFQNIVMEIANYEIVSLLFLYILNLLQ